MHELYRSYYHPVKCCCDGGIVAGYFKLSDSDQREIADKLKITPFEISKIIAKNESIV
jgi:plasmid maintenance system antidote protein VapI